MEDEVKQEVKMSEKVLGELEVIELLVGKLKEQVKTAGETIAKSGDPEQNAQANAMQLYGLVNNGINFYNDEIVDSLRNLSYTLGDIRSEYLGVKENEDDGFRQLTATARARMKMAEKD